MCTLCNRTMELGQRDQYRSWPWCPPSMHPAAERCTAALLDWQCKASSSCPCHAKCPERCILTPLRLLRSGYSADNCDS